MRKSILASMVIISMFFVGCKEDRASVNVVEKTEISVEGKEILKELTSDKYEGRLVGSEGNKFAEDYLEEIFKELDLKPVFNNKYKQAYEQEVAPRYGRLREDEESKVKTVNNIIGKINGNDSDCAIIISAHFDHIGIQDEQIVRGAIDNASGISVLTTIAKSLKKELSNYDVIFCAFNGEETGLAGSRNFVKHIKDKYKNMININIDSVGYENSEYIQFLNQRDTELEKQMKKILEKNDLVFGKSNLKGVSDGKSFDEYKIENVTLIDAGVKEIIHSERDTLDKVDYKRLEKISNAVVEFIKGYSF